MPSYQSLDDGKSVLLYDPTGTNLTIEFCKELRRRINGWHGRQVNVKEVGENLSMPCYMPVITVCHNHSRLGTDIDSATASLKDSDQSKPYIAIAALHAKERHALPVTMPTETLYDEKYEQYGLMVDYAFIPENGIYSCEMNTKADAKLKSFLQKHLKLAPISRSSLNPCPENNDRKWRTIIAVAVGVALLIVIVVLLVLYA